MQHHMDSAIGVHIIDRWTYYALEFLEKVTSGSKATLKDFVSLDACMYLHSTLSIDMGTYACIPVFLSEKNAKAAKVGQFNLRGGGGGAKTSHH